MCGIYGHYSFNGPLTLDEEIVSLNKLTHRGPDGFGFEHGCFNGDSWYELVHNKAERDTPVKNITYFLGHRRLSIIDLSDNAFQPMETQCQRYSITFNGEIYNYVELKEELLEKGYAFTTDHSDTEVLLACYKTWGYSCVEKLRGMFAFAIFDREDGIVFIARDRIGQKTLYYSLNNDAFKFSSELTPLTHKNNSLKIDNLALNLYLALGYIPHPHSIYQGVNKLPPASYAVVNLANQNIEVNEYWDLENHLEENQDFETAVSNAKAMLGESVRYRLRSDVSMGAFISGGIDSTLIVKNISEQSSQQLDIYGADFPETSRSEKPYIEEAADRYKQNLKLIAIDNSKIGNISDIVRVFDEPFDGASSIALFDLFEVAARDHKVILTGDGGDEMYAGYDRYLKFPGEQKKRKRLKAILMPELIARLLSLFKPLKNRANNFVAELNNSALENLTGINSSSDLSGLLKLSMQRSRKDKTGAFSAIYESAQKKRFSPVKLLQYLELKTILPGRMLYKLDRFSMRYSVEARSPFLDHKLAELAFSVPDELTQRNQTGKAVLKNILVQDFGEHFIHREKSGFGNPLELWLNGAHRAQALGILSDPNSLVFKFLDFKNTHSLFPEILSVRKKPKTKALWRLLVLAHFMEQNKSQIDFDAQL